MASSKKNIAVIGCGYWGTILINSLYKINCKNIFVYDNKKENLETVKKRFPNIKTNKNFSQLLKSKNIKSFFLATPPDVNFNFCKKLIENNKNIFVEKPVVKTIAEINKIKKLLFKKKIIFMSGYIYCYNDCINFIKKIIKKKFLGEIKYINLIRKNFGPIRHSVSSALDLSSHDISILLYIFQKKISVIKYINHSILKKKINDISNMFYKIGKIKVDINSSWLFPEKVRKIIIIGTKKMLLFNEMEPANPIKIFNKYAEYPKLSFFNKKYFNKTLKFFVGKNVSVKINNKPALLNELNHFFYCVNNKKKPITCIDFAREVLKKIN